MEPNVLFSTRSLSILCEVFNGFNHPCGNIDHPVLIDFCLFLLILAVTWVVANQEGHRSMLHRRSSKRHFAICIPHVKFLFCVVFSKANEGFLSIQLDPTTVNVNVHPTKREVHFLEEEGITESIADAIQAKLAQSGERTFEYQTLLTGGIASADTGKGKDKVHENSAGSDSASSTPLPGPPAVAKKILSQLFSRAWAMAQ
ncbi:hypothetical protein EDB84DRAFT_1564434 [Lactarius hengduanensis]|nr:hypothetical protein EDB84DRAFT_1564434 [Lactarius hengduanensis]